VSDHQLILVPRDPAAGTVDTTTLRQALRSIGFSGAPVVGGSEHDFPGPRFLDLLHFNEPPPPGTLWAPHTIELTGPTEEIEFLGGADTESPSCPRCAEPVSDWADVLSAWYEAKNTYVASCHACNWRGPVWDLNWQISCGFGKQSIVVWHIGYRQAQPAEELLASLGGLGVGRWSYFSYRL
jgi:hypothetical protein